MAATVGVLGGTRWGLERILDLASGAIDGSIDAQVTAGSILGGFTLEQLHVELGRTTLDLDRIEIAWRPMALVGGALHLEKASLGRLTLATAELGTASQTPPPPPAEGLELPGLDLPIDVRIDALTLIALGSRGHAEPIVEDVSLRGRVVSDVVEIESLTGDVGAGRLHARGSLALEGPWEHALSASFAGETASVDVRIEGDVNLTRLEITSESLGASVSGTLSELTEQLSWTLTARMADPPATSPLAALAFARIRGSGTLSAMTLAGEVRQGNRTLDIRQLELERAADRLALRSGRVELPADGITVSLAGALTLPVEGGRVDAALNGGAQIDRPDIDADLDFSLSGHPEAYALTIGGELAGSPLSARITGNRGSARISEAHWGRDEEMLELTGEVDWSDELRWRTDLRGRGLDPIALTGRFEPLAPGAIGDASGELFAELGSSLVFTVTAEGTGNRYEVHLEQLAGTLRGHPVEGRGEFSGAGARVDEIDLRLTTGEAVLQARGRWGATGPVGALELTVPALGDLIPNAAGNVRINADADETGVTVAGDVTGFRFGASSLAKATLAGAASLSDDPDARLTLELTDLEADGLRLHTSRIEVTGWRDAASASYRASVTDLGHLDGRIDYVELDESRTVELASLSIATNDFGRWALDEPLRIELQGRAMRTNRACLRAAIPDSDGRLCFEADLVPGEAGEILATLRALPLRLIEPSLSASVGEPLRLGGALNGDVRARTEGLSWSGVSVELGGQDLSIASPERSADAVLVLRDLDLRVEGDASALSFDGKLATSNGRAAATGTLEDPMTGLGAVRSGEVSMELDELADLQPLIPFLPGLTGRAEARLAIDGPLSMPTIEGTLDAVEIDFEVPGQGVRVRDAELRAVVAPGGVFDPE